MFEYNTAEYNIAEFSGGTLVDTVRAPGSGSGSVLQLGFEADLSYCIDVNAFNTVPCYQNGSVKRLDDCL